VTGAGLAVIKAGGVATLVAHCLIFTILRYYPWGVAVSDDGI
jgi:hypothetical protein